MALQLEPLSCNSRKNIVYYYKPLILTERRHSPYTTHNTGSLYQPFRQFLAMHTITEEDQYGNS